MYFGSHLFRDPSSMRKKLIEGLSQVCAGARVSTVDVARGSRRECTHVMHGRGCIAIDPRNPAILGRRTSGFHRPPGRIWLRRVEGGEHACAFFVFAGFIFYLFLFFRFCLLFARCLLITREYFSCFFMHFVARLVSLVFFIAFVFVFGRRECDNEGCDKRSLRPCILIVFLLRCSLSVFGWIRLYVEGWVMAHSRGWTALAYNKISRKQEPFR